ncbi:hypothetical protein FSP39_000619 [Pinctada imbricata]|uniref:Uncharacterized protein n=1 Tax=Pinctada imbricata TaxID=66713 RepID=A0AA89CAF8_PINIB|nr:hypothetical protein FSP39_000619 [Pinctada imbricata]
MWQNTKEMFRHYVLADELLNQTHAYTRHIDELERAILQLSQGYLSPLLISDKQIESAASEIMRELSNEKHIQNLLHASPHYYRRSHSFIAYRHKHSLWITLKFPIAPQKAMHLYKVNVFPMSVHKDSTFSTIIEGLPDYVIYDEKTRFAELQAKDLMHCHDTATTQSCLGIETPVSRRYLINMAVMRSFYGNAISKSLEASKAFLEEQNYKKPNIELYNHDYEKFLTSDKEDSYTFKKTAKVALEGRKAFHSISQALLAGEVDIRSNWDNTTLFKLLICCFVAIAILVIVEIAYEISVC